jgi:hypothetical protein
MERSTTRHPSAPGTLLVLALAAAAAGLAGPRNAWSQPAPETAPASTPAAAAAPAPAAAAPPMVAAAPAVGTTEAPPAAASSVWLGAGVDQSLLAFPSSKLKASTMALALRLGGGYQTTNRYLRGSLAILSGTAPEEKVGGELALAGGYRRGALQVGGRIDGRITSSSFGDPWVDRSFDVGVESAQCLWRQAALELCLHQFVAPFGWHQRQGAVDSGLLVRIPMQSDYQFRIDVGVELRFDPFASRRAGAAQGGSPR